MFGVSDISAPTAGTMGVGGGAWGVAMAETLSAPSAPEKTPTAVSFGSVTSPGYFETLPSGFTDFTETFGSTSPFTKYTESTAGAFSVASNIGTLAHTANQNDIIVETSSSFTIPDVWVQIDVPSIPTPCNTGFDNGGVGIVKDANNFLFASLDRKAGTARIQIKIAGTNTFLTSVAHTWTAPFTFALSLVGNDAALWHNVSGTWTKITQTQVASKYNFQTDGNLTGWRAGFTYANGGASGTWNFQNLICGRYGGVGMRDMTIVTNEDGSPYYVGNYVYFTATVPGPGGFLASRTCVFKLDTTTNTIVRTGTIYIDRSSALQLDQAAHIIVYPNGDRRLTIATWGNGFGGAIDVLSKLITNGSQPDILTAGSSVVSGMTSLGLPLGGSGVGCYDAMLAYDSANSRWLCAYIITNDTSFTGNPFYAALAYCSDITSPSWTLIGADTGHTGYEGAKLLKNNGAYYVLVGGPAGLANTSRIYDATLTYLGALSGAVFSGGSSTQPHPMVFPLQDGVTQMLLTFDNTKYPVSTGNTFTWGQPKIQTASRY